MNRAEKMGCVPNGAPEWRSVKEHCDHIIKLPMQGKVNSLNASVATGVIIFEIMRQRKGKP